MNRVVKSYLVIITLEKSLGSPTEDGIVTSLKECELAPFPSIVELYHGFIG